MILRMSQKRYSVIIGWPQVTSKKDVYKTSQGYSQFTGLTPAYWHTEPFANYKVRNVSRKPSWRKIYLKPTKSCILLLRLDIKTREISYRLLSLLKHQAHHSFFAHLSFFTKPHLFLAAYISSLHKRQCLWPTLPNIMVGTQQIQRTNQSIK